jgi:sulfonate transport system substrate-binding protein
MAAGQLKRPVIDMERPGSLTWFSTSLLAGVLVSSIGLAGDSAPTDASVIRIAVVAIQSGGKPSFFGPPEYMAQDPILKAELEKRHASIEWVPVSSVAVATLVNEAFTSQRIDFAYYGDLPSVILNASGFQTRLVAPGNVGNNVYLMVPSGSTARSIADLKGKRIALNRGRPWEVSFEKLLTANGLNISDFKIVNLNPQAGASAFVSGSVDAFVTLDDAFLLVDKGLGKIIWSTKEAPPDWKMRAELWGSAEFIEQHPDLTQVLANADLRAVRWISEDQNRSAYLRDLADRYSYPQSVIDREYAGEAISWHNYWSPLYSPSITLHYQGVVAYARGAGLIRNDVAVGSLIVPRFVDAGLKQLGLDGYWKPQASL